MDTRSAVQIPNTEFKVAAIRLRKGQAASKKTDVAGGEANAVKYLQEIESGHVDEVIGGVPTDWVPEGDVFDPNVKRPRLIARGWRSLALGLAKKNLCTLERARRVFNCSGLGDSAYDRGGLDAKWEAQCPEQARKAKDPIKYGV